MSPNSEPISAEELRRFIDLMNPCIDDCLYVYDIQNDYYYISPHATQRYAIPQNGFHNVVETLAGFVYPPDMELLSDDIRQLIEGVKDYHNLEYRWLSKTGDPIWINCRGRIVRQGERDLYLVGCINEIGVRQKADNVSGLLSVSSFRRNLEKNYYRGMKGYLLRIGIDDFREINAKMGFEYGDQILRQVADCLSSYMAPENRLYRLVADEFVISHIYGSTAQDALDLYRRLRRGVDDLVEDNLYETVFTISGGILPFDQIDDPSFSNVTKLSEFTLNMAKQMGKNRCYIFSASDYEQFLRRQDLTTALRWSVNHGFQGFEVHYQPLIHTGSQKLYGAEALMRFHAEPFGNVPPSEIVPLLEESGLIIPVGRHILNQALKACADILPVLPDFHMSVNVSYIQVIKSDFVNDVMQAVSACGLDPSHVILELTESGKLESDSRFTRLWTRLKDKGIRLALDDFGTGYSNFHYLNDLQPHIIKIDRSFTSQSLTNEYDYHLLSLMRGMAQKLHLNFCIEGVENLDELERLLPLNPDYCQGYHFGRPCPYEQFVANFLPG